MPKYVPDFSGFGPEAVAARDADPRSLVRVFPRSPRRIPFLASIFKIVETKQPHNPVVGIIREDGEEDRIGGGTTVVQVDRIEAVPLHSKSGRSSLWQLLFG